MKRTVILVHFDATVLIPVQVPAVLSTFVSVPRVQMSTQWKRQITFSIILNDGQTSRKVLIFFSSHGIADENPNEVLFHVQEKGKNCKFCEHRGLLLWIRCNRNFASWPVVVCIGTTTGKHFGCHFRTHAYLMTQQFYPRENCACWYQDGYTRMFIAVLFVVAKIGNVHMSSNSRINTL